jgi:transposase
VFYQLKNGCNWSDLPKDLPPYSTVFWHYKHWRKDGVLDEIMDVLHAQVRQYAQKNRNRLVRNINLGEKKMVGVFDMSYHHGKSNRLYS